MLGMCEFRTGAVWVSFISALFIRNKDRQTIFTFS